MEEKRITPESHRKAVRKYLSKFKEIKLRTLPEEHAVITAHAKAAGDRSTVAFVMRAIEEAMERDKQRQKDILHSVGKEPAGISTGMATGLDTGKSKAEEQML